MNETPPVARYRAALAALDPRISMAAQLRALFPLIEAELAMGVPHLAVLDDLAAAGLTVQRRTFAITLYRWRKARRTVSRKQWHAAYQSEDVTVEPVRATAPTPQAPALDAIQGRPRNIQTPGDLRKIRDMRIDLDALRREGIANRNQSSENTTNPVTRDKE